LSERIRAKIYQGGKIMRINHNIAALNTHRQLTANQALASRSLERLSSGLRVNRAGDDAAGLGISEGMRGQIRGLNQAIRNAQDGVSLIQTAEGALNETHSILQRMRELAVQSANDTNITADRTSIQAEVTQLIAEVDRIASTTQFNTQVLLDGGFATTALTFHVGANVGQTVALNIATMNATGLAIAGVNVGTQTFANAAIGDVATAINSVSTARSSLGAMQNRLNHTINNLGTSSENLSAAESRIRDVDMASEMMQFTKMNILQQAAQAMLAQAMQQPQGVLQLLR